MVEKWTKFYAEMVERNIGIVNYQEQEKIRTSHVAIFGVGGMGGRIAEILVRVGCENITIIDRDTYSISNLSTQSITQEDIGKSKVDVLAKTFQKINPNVDIRKFYEVTEENISEILTNITIATLSLDGPFGSIIVTRECRKQNIPIVEAWSMPFLYAWWFTNENPNYESCYGLDTHSRSILDLKNDPQFPTEFKNHLYQFFSKFPNAENLYNKEPTKLTQMKNGEISLRSLAPFAVMTGAYLAFEIVFVGILKQKSMILAPKIKAFDIFNCQVLDLGI